MADAKLIGNATTWKPESEHVAQTTLNENGAKTSTGKGVDFIEAGTVLICAGPAKLDSGNEVEIVPIGLIEQASVNQNKPLQRVFEIGSKLSYIIPGRTVGAMSINRVMFDGPSLLKMLVSGEVKSRTDAADGTETITLATQQADGNTEIDVQKAGSGLIDINLASKIFDISFGMAMYFRDQKNDDLSTIYFEDVRISTHNFGIASQSTIIAESVNMEFVQIVPIEVTDTSGNE